MTKSIPQNTHTNSVHPEHPECRFFSSDPYPECFTDIAPYYDGNFFDRLEKLIKKPGFENAIKYIMPDVNYDSFCNSLLNVEIIDDFQRKIVGNFLEFLASKTSSGITADGFENVRPDRSYTYLSNHRDIVLDASFLNLCFIRQGYPITQIAIGNNLLIYDWINDLVRINRSFIVKRDVKPLQALEVAKQLSAYIHYVIAERHESIWIAQREGRAKDSNDVTQESLLKMLSIGRAGSIAESLSELNILPVSISYEFDPNDYLKVKEFLLKQRDPEYKKSQHDDLFSMETGLLQHKGRIHFQLNRPVNSFLKNNMELSRHETIKFVRETIDREIHAGYKIFPVNYIAFDKLNKTDKFAKEYTEEDIAEAENYFQSQLAKIDVEDITQEERNFCKEMLLNMYANPLQNKIKALAELKSQSEAL